MQITLQQVSLHDANLIKKWYEQPELCEYFRRYPPMMDWSLPEQILSGLGWCYFIVEDNKKVGLIQLLNADTQAKSIEVAMLINKEECSNRRLVSFEAYHQLCEYIFNYMDYNKMYMKVLTTRYKLKNRLEFGGWKIEAHYRQSCKFKGELRDEWVLGLLKQDYKDRELSKGGK